MKMDDQSTPRLRVPKPGSDVVGAAVMTSFILFFVALALSNLADGLALIPSLIWLLLVTAVFVGVWREEGTRQFFTGILGEFSLKHFAEIVEPAAAPQDVRFGFSCLGHRMFYQTIPVNKIESLEWHTGQATSLAGRDMDDWHVTLWFDHGDPGKSEQQKEWYRKPDQDLYIIGPSRPKEVTAAFGREALDFLRAAGAALVQGENDCTFVRNSDSRRANPATELS
ncbi:MAG: hypothetical protein HN742_43070 [Lentisphaerae bacterium]|jgi:hypothetical protein|nr:hypothetical protein [Lentisphaerota bacterium]MBT5604304.1 hypothetical protein [Lentisphaerota bacterium]MBT7054460.1 hypothetical protein [Lentisphaerota bacterium]MBT7848720.1 hypothetical protein [Lentisphaerota bacterium]